MTDTGSSAAWLLPPDSNSRPPPPPPGQPARVDLPFAGPLGRPAPPPRSAGWNGSRALADLWYRLDHEQPLKFDAVVQAHAAATGLRPNLSAEIRAEAHELRFRLRAAFAEQHGRLEAMYLCSRRVIGGAALTEGVLPDVRGRRVRRTLHTVLNSSEPALLGVADRAEALANDAVTVFADRPAWLPQMRRATDEVYAVISRVLSAVEQEDDRERAAAVLAAQQEADATAQRVEVLIQRQSRFTYLGGALAGAVLCIGLAVLLGLADRRWWAGQVAVGPFLAAGIFGVFGAVTSVFQRISNGSLILDYTAGLWQKRLLGALRPVVGGVLGVTAHFVLVGGILGGRAAAADARATFAFFALIGFAAGFSERFATDMIERAGKVLAGTATQTGGQHRSGRRAAGREEPQDRVTGPGG